MTDTPKMRIGLAAMDPVRAAEIKSQGGKASPNRPFKDPSAASRASKARWEKYRLTQAGKHDNS